MVENVDTFYLDQTAIFSASDRVFEYWTIFRGVSAKYAIA